MAESEWAIWDLNKQNFSCLTCEKSLSVPFWKYQIKKKKEFYCDKMCWLRRPIIPKICKFCDHQFKRVGNRVGKKGYIYCSRKCRYQDPESFFRKGKKLDCLLCKQSLSNKPLGQKYCSISCRSSDFGYKKKLKLAKNVTSKLVSCKVCEKQTRRHRFELMKTKNFFCSNECRGRDLRGKMSPKRNGKEVSCFNCSKKVYRAKWRLVRYSRHFCSMFCNNELSKFNMFHITKPTKPERIFMELIEEYNLPYRYVGDGKFWIGHMNPDFISTNGTKRVVEVFGDFWHNPQRNKHLSSRHTESGRKRLLKNYGFDCIVIWENEFNMPDWKGHILNKLGSTISEKDEINYP